MKTTQTLLKDAEQAIQALREYIQALPEDVVATLPAMPAMPGIDGDWLDEVQTELTAAVAKNR